MVHSLGEIQSFTAGKVWLQATPSWWEWGVRASPLQEIGNPAINFKTQHTGKLLPPARLYLLKFPPSPKAASPAGTQVSKHMIPWKTFYIQTTIKG